MILCSHFELNSTREYEDGKDKKKKNAYVAYFGVSSIICFSCCCSWAYSFDTQFQLEFEKKTQTYIFMRRYLKHTHKNLKSSWRLNFIQLLMNAPIGLTTLFYDRVISKHRNGRFWNRHTVQCANVNKP